MLLLKIKKEDLALWVLKVQMQDSEKNEHVKMVILKSICMSYYFNLNKLTFSL